MPKRRLSCFKSGTQRYLGGGQFKALSWKLSHRSAVNGPLLKERHGSEARQRQAFLLVYIYI